MTALEPEKTVKTAIGPKSIDTAGSAVSVVHVDPHRAYSGSGALLAKVIREGDRSAWETICTGIDYLYAGMDTAMSGLNREIDFAGDIADRLKQGQKLLFKPNLVNISVIDPVTSQPGPGAPACTEWTFVAAVMRWFHDQLQIPYHRMCVGEAATTMSAVADLFSKKTGRFIPPEAVVEGKSDDFFGGWGFYFVRQYLAERLPAGSDEDPMAGYEESVRGIYLPPGLATDKLMVYDLNRLSDDPDKGRDIIVPEGVNFKSILIHKAVVGGDPADPEDRRRYPGSVVINLPRLKVHSQALLTNAIKNLGIGLFPMQASRQHNCHWEYAIPHIPVPSFKARVPHQRWVAEIDPVTLAPLRDADGNYRVTETGGLTASMIDINMALRNENISWLHVVDGIEAINVDHQGIAGSTRIPEGLIVAGADPVAVDNCCARYLFSNLGLAASDALQMKDRFPRRVPVARLEKGQIVTAWDHECLLSRDSSFAAAEKRGMGKQAYYVVGRDMVSDNPLVSIEGRLGSVHEGVFKSLVTDVVYYSVFKLSRDLYRTFLSYLEAVDLQSGTRLAVEFLEAFDEDGDGVASYEEFGRKGHYSASFWHEAMLFNVGDHPLADRLRVRFNHAARTLKWCSPEWNGEGHDINQEQLPGQIFTTAYFMSLAPAASDDPFHPGMTWGAGNWPSWELARTLTIGQILYGTGFPAKIDLKGLYGIAFSHADQTQNQGRYTGSRQARKNAITTYQEALREKTLEPLAFVFYVMPGFKTVMGHDLPHVVETSDASKILTAEFGDGPEIWPRILPAD
ncbi:MAG: DUF362 domain-containing protein, partial [bacterium]